MLVGSTRDLSAQKMDLNSVSLESVTKVEQLHNPGLGSNYLALNIWGRSGGNPMNVKISVNTPGWGAQKLIDSCEKHAMLVMHYPDRYHFEVVSGDGGQDGSVTLNVNEGSLDAVICSVKAKSQTIDPRIPSTSVLKSPVLTN